MHTRPRHLHGQGSESAAHVHLPSGLPTTSERLTNSSCCRESSSDSSGFVSVTATVMVRLLIFWGCMDWRKVIYLSFLYKLLKNQIICHYLLGKINFCAPTSPGPRSCSSTSGTFRTALFLDLSVPDKACYIRLFCWQPFIIQGADDL